MNTPKRVAVIGFDCALPHLIEKHEKGAHNAQERNCGDVG